MEDDWRRARAAFGALFDSDDEDALAACEVQTELSNNVRGQALFRRRWDCEYLVDLAIKENSFVAEYRVDVAGFDLLNQMLETKLGVNEEMAARAMNVCGSAPISTASRLGAALIMLGGGRRIEAMRTHGISQAQAYTNLHRVVAAINQHPSLAIKCDNSLDALQQRGDGFNCRSLHRLFPYTTGAIDGLAIRIIAPSVKEAQDQGDNAYTSTEQMLVPFPGYLCYNLGLASPLRWTRTVP
ncbi:hypothetical protein B484DRAFT_396117 [Ochromonadaceae sp. CCMP2298]|nr:hypothetical protein B484DRAFT_396117 [Ochromonadaceae sp. CCMP2298]